MQPFCRRSILIACGVAMLGGAACLLAGGALAETYPSHPVKIVVPFPAGGSNDIVARVIAQKLSERNNGQTVFVENRGGAGGNIGAEAVASSDPDGYTLLLTAPPPLTINAALYKDLRYDPRAFAPVALIASVPIVLAVHPSLGVEQRRGTDRARQGKAGHAVFRIVRQRFDQPSRRRIAEEHDAESTSCTFPTKARRRQ